MAADRVIDDYTAAEAVNPSKPRRILLFSGKRKSGKDYITNTLQERIGHDSGVIIRLSGPIKYQWAKSEGLDFDELLSDGKYKENHRLRMAKWGENVRKEDYGYFCRAAIEMYKTRNKPIWIVSDARRKSDIQWFTDNFGDICKTIRIVSDDSIRNKRGWIFTPGIDDAETECDLDDFSPWDLIVTNNNGDMNTIFQDILKLVTT